MRTVTEHDTLCSTDKGRKKCVARIETLAKKHGATIEFHEFNGPREIGLELCFGPYKCMIYFEGGSKVGAFMGHWHVSHESDARYPVHFGADIFGSINTFHYSKATTCQTTWHGFLISLERGLESLAIEMAHEAA